MQIKNKLFFIFLIFLNLCLTNLNVNADEFNISAKEIIVDKLAVDLKSITADAKFIDDLGADSLDIVELIMQFEEDFDIEIPDEDAEKILSVNQAVDYINSKL